MRALLVALLFAAFPAQAQDTWTGRDKAVHLAVGFVLGAISADYLREEPAYIRYTGPLAVAVLREVIVRPFSRRDLAVTGLGIMLGDAAIGWYITKQQDTVVVGYQWTLP
jgi:hypothetical protein